MYLPNDTYQSWVHEGGYIRFLSALPDGETPNIVDRNRTYPPLMNPTTRYFICDAFNGAVVCYRRMVDVSQLIMTLNGSGVNRSRYQGQLAFVPTAAIGSLVKQYNK